jgi:hypothetical protein
MRNINTQSGIALIIFLTILVLGTTAVLLSKLNKNRTAFMLEDQAQTARALAQAKDALLGHAMIYAETHDGQPQGYLPCPDHDGDGSASACGDDGHSVIGRLPWRTLGLPLLRDGSGECLWYAVSGGYKNNPKQPLTSDTDGLFIVKNAKNETIAGTTEAERAIAIIFAPGRPIGGQVRAATNGSMTECGSTDINDYLNKASNYLDNFQGISNATGDKDIIDNTNDDILKRRPSISANFWVTASPSYTPTFINAPLTREYFNDALMLITPKDFEPVYNRMNYWVMERVISCIEEYNTQYLKDYKARYATAITEYKDTYSDEINKYVEYHRDAWIERWKKQYQEDPTSHDTPVPTTKEITKKETQLREIAVKFTNKYPWASKVDSSYETDEVGQLFGRIPDAPSESYKKNNDMAGTWENIKYADVPCFNFEDSNLLEGNKWGWWNAWRDMVFYAVDEKNSPSTLAYLWVGYYGVGYDKTDAFATISSAGILIKYNEFAANSVPEPLSTELQLNSSGQEKIVIVAGRKLVLNEGNPPSDPNPEYQQKRSSADDQKEIKNYLEGDNSDGDKSYESQIATPDFNDFVCTHNYNCKEPK